MSSSHPSNQPTTHNNTNATHATAHAYNHSLHNRDDLLCQEEGNGHVEVAHSVFVRDPLDLFVFIVARGWYYKMVPKGSKEIIGQEDTECNMSQ